MSHTKPAELKRQKWTKPAVKRLRAGAAEIGGALTTDIGFSNS